MQQTTVLVRNHYDLLHGGAEALPGNLAELVALGASSIGPEMQGDEFHCSICVKDSSGPYSRALGNRLRKVAHRTAIDLRADVFPYPALEGAAGWNVAGQAELAFIGPGVDNCHGYERAHQEALRDTSLMVAEYLVED